MQLLSKFYADVADVDLLVGCLLEPTVDDSMIGETTRCVLADGFYRLRYGDRFFCDVEGQPGSFTPGPCAVKMRSAESDDDLKRVFFALRRAIRRFVEYESHHCVLRHVGHRQVAARHFYGWVTYAFVFCSITAGWYCKNKNKTFFIKLPVKNYNFFQKRLRNLGD